MNKLRHKIIFFYLLYNIVCNLYKISFNKRFYLEKYVKFYI